jgi:hypothetical protein
MMNELDEKYNHLVQVMESEKTLKWQLMQQCDDQAETIAILRNEVWLQNNTIMEPRLVTRLFSC